MTPEIPDHGLLTELGRRLVSGSLTDAGNGLTPGPLIAALAREPVGTLVYQ